MKISPEHDFHDRSKIVAHLESDFHGWRDVRRATDGSQAPDPLGWHAATGGYLIGDAELLALHRELHPNRGKVLIVQLPPGTKIDVDAVHTIRERLMAELENALND